MSLGTIKIGQLEVSRLILGSNPFSGFSHQSPEMDNAMRHYYSTRQIIEVLHGVEALGLNSLLARADHHIMRLLLEYWDDGGKLQWMAQTCPELGETSRGVQNAINGGAKACYVHGGRMDYLLAQNQLQEAIDAVAMIHDAGMPAGIAGHNPRVFAWAEEHVAADFYMCSYYNPTIRDDVAEHVSGSQELFDDRDRDAMVSTIAQLSKPVIHYKVLAAGRHRPQDALAFVARHLRPQDAVCVGIFPKDHPNMMAENMQILEACLQAKA